MYYLRYIIDGKTARRIKSCRHFYLIFGEPQNTELGKNSITRDKAKRTYKADLIHIVREYKYYV